MAQKIEKPQTWKTGLRYLAPGVSGRLSVISCGGYDHPQERHSRKKSKGNIVVDSRELVWMSDNWQARTGY